MNFNPDDVKTLWLDWQDDKDGWWEDLFVFERDFRELLEEYRKLEHGSGRNEKLYEKLKKLLPPEPEDKTATWNSKINFKPDFLGYGTDAFFRFLDGELPRNDRELHDILHVYGKFMFKETEARAEYWRKVATDFMNLDTRPIYVKVAERVSE